MFYATRVPIEWKPKIPNGIAMILIAVIKNAENSISIIRNAVILYIKTQFTATVSLETTNTTNQQRENALARNYT